MENSKIWYAYQYSDDDSDWGTGTYDRREAMDALESGKIYRIAVIEEGNDPICIEEIYR